MNNERGVVFMSKGTLNKKYTGEYKQMVVETMQREKMSCWQADLHFGLPKRRSASWERIFLEEGVEGLYIERRGRSCKISATEKGCKSQLDKKVEEDLISEVQRLRAEVAYLKKLNALVLKEESQNKKHK